MKVVAIMKNYQHLKLHADKKLVPNCLKCAFWIPNPKIFVFMSAKIRVNKMFTCSSYGNEIEFKTKLAVSRKQDCRHETVSYNQTW